MTTKQPDILVRYNRATELRKASCKVGDKDLQSWTSPANSEASGSVQGKIRASNVALKQEIFKWYREQLITCNKMSRQQNNMYDSFLRFEKELPSGEHLPPPRLYERALLWDPIYARQAEKKKPKVFEYRETHSGRVVRTNARYKRREFSVPVERTDSPMRELMERADREYEALEKRQEALFQNIKKWEESPPVLLAPIAKEKSKLSDKNAYGTLNNEMRALMAAYAHMGKGLEGVDPNSEEGLRRTRYIRRDEGEQKLFEGFEPGDLTAPKKTPSPKLPRRVSMALMKKVNLAKRKKNVAVK